MGFARVLGRLTAAATAVVAVLSFADVASSAAAAVTCTAEPFTIVPPDFGLDVCVGNNLGEFLGIVAAASAECSLEDLLALPNDPTIKAVIDVVKKMAATPDQISVLFYQHMQATQAPQMDALCTQLNTVVSPCAKTLLPGLLALAQRDVTCCSQLSDLLDLAHLVVPSTMSVNAFVLNDVVNGVNRLLCSKRDNAQTCGTSLYTQLTTKYTQAQFSLLDAVALPFYTAAAGHECNALSGKDFLNSATLAPGVRAIDFGCCVHQLRPLVESLEQAFEYLLGTTIDAFLNGIVEFDVPSKQFQSALGASKACVFASTCTNPSNLIPAIPSVIAPGNYDPKTNELVDTECTRVQKCDARGTTCSTVCAKGSVVVPAWLSQTLAAERQLAATGPMCYAQLPATHNSAITLADGFGNRDQLFNRNLNPQKPYSYLKTNNHVLSLTDQLQLGVRWLEVDVHYFLDDLRTAHCGNLGSASVTALFGAIDAQLRKYGAILWGPELLGCFPSISGIRADEQPTTRSTLLEIRAWLDRPENQREALFLYLDTGSELARLHKLGELDAVVTDVFRDVLVPLASLQALAATQWTGANATLQHFVDRGQRVFVFANSNTALAYRMQDFCNGHKILDTKFITALPDAARQLGGVQLYSDNYFVRSYQSVLRYISLSETGSLSQTLPVTLDANNMANYVRWNVNLVATDQLDMARMTAHAWSWAANEPAVRATVFVAPATGRWIASATVALTWKACWRAPTLEWRIVAFTTECASGFAFVAPQDPFQNYLLRNEIAAQKIVIPVVINVAV